MTRELISRNGALFAEFDDPEVARRALDALRARGYTYLDTFSPFPLTVEQARKPAPWPALAIIVFVVATIGALAGYLVQWYANARSYPLNIGGRPANAIPAFFVASVESLLLLGVVTVFVGLLIALRLPRLWRPINEIDGFDRSSIDRYWIVVRLGSGGGDIVRTDQELQALKAVRVLHGVTEP